MSEEKNDKTIIYVVLITLICIGVAIFIYINNNNNNSKDNVINVLLNRGFSDYAGDKIMYHNRESIPYDTNGACEGATTFNFNTYEYGIYFVCYENDRLAYSREEMYNWKYNTLNSNVTQYDYYNGQQTKSLYVKATIDDKGNSNCNINDCETYLTSLEGIKYQFLNIITTADVPITDLIN